MKTKNFIAYGLGILMIVAPTWAFAKDEGDIAPPDTLKQIHEFKLDETSTFFHKVNKWTSLAAIVQVREEGEEDAHLLRFNFVRNSYGPEGYPMYRARYAKTNGDVYMFLDGEGNVQDLRFVAEVPEE